MVDIIKKAEDDYSTYIITIENPTVDEYELVKHTLKTIKHNRSAMDLETTTSSIMGTDEDVICIAQEIIKSNQVNRKIAAGVKEQILLDLQEGKDLSYILSLAAEVIGRLTGEGDAFYRKVVNLEEEKKGETL